MALRAAEVETLFTANVDEVIKAEKTIKATGQRVEKNPLKVDADAKPALDGMDRVEEAAKKLVSKDTIATVDANIERGEKNLDRVQKRLEYLRSVETDLDVKADISRAEASLSKVSRNLDGLKSARAVMEVDADTSAADDALDGAKDKAGDAGEDSGEAFGKSIIAALVSIPIAGAVIGVAAAAAKGLVDAFNEGLQVEVGYDRLQALTGIDPAAAVRLGNAAGEAYANNFGESIESNMDATRLALQFRILDPTATTRDAQLVVQGLSGIADVLGEDVKPVATAVSTLLSTGVSKTAKEAFDLIATGARNGVNRADDLLDTLTEYPALFQRLGLSGPEALGLISQGLDAGARNSDLAADALKEFQIRATDASVASAAGFELLGLNAEEMTAKIAAGGEGAREGLAQVLDGLRAIEDPVARNAAAVALFGTQAEDLGAALFAMDLSTAVDQLDGVTGSAQRMFDTLADNDASKISQAQRNIEVAAEGIKGALAGAFAEPLGDFADWVSQNRGPVLQFFADLVDGAIDFAISATEGVGSFVAGPLAEMIEGLAVAIKFFDWGADTSELDELAESMRGFETTTDGVVDKLEGMRGEFNGFADGQIALGYVNDAALRTADSISQVGLAVDGSRFALTNLDLANLDATESGQALQEQLDLAAQSLRDEYDAAIAAGESQDNLRGRYAATSEALMGQLTAMGLTQEQAQSLIDTVLATPEEATTVFTSNAEAETGKVVDLGNRIVTLPDGDTTIRANTEPAATSLEKLIINNNGRSITLRVLADGSGFKLPGGQVVSAQYHGGLVEFMANGGLRGLTPMSPIAQMVPANTWRVVGDRGDVPELYAPLDGSARSWALIMEGLRRMPGTPPQMMAEGGVTGAPTVQQLSLAGLQIEGRLRIDADGFAELVDARIVADRDQAATRVSGGGMSA